MVVGVQVEGYWCMCWAGEAFPAAVAFLFDDKSSRERAIGIVKVLLNKQKCYSRYTTLYLVSKLHCLPFEVRPPACGFKGLEPRYPWCHGCPWTLPRAGSRYTVSATRRTARTDGTGRYWVNTFTRWPPVAQVYSIEKELGRREEDGVTWS